jgi:hypothetical protein
MICTWCEKWAEELFPVPRKDGSAQVVCRSCADLARRVARWALFLGTARMPAAESATHQSDGADPGALPN